MGLVSVPWQMWQPYRDRDLLARQYPLAVAWVEFAETMVRTTLAPERIAANAKPLEHEKFLWDTGLHWGEWLEPGVEPAPGGDEAIVATAYFAKSAHLLARTAEVLGKGDDAARWSELAQNVARAWATEFVGSDGRLARDSQAGYVRALAFGLLPHHLVPSAVDRLVELIRAAVEAVAEEVDVRGYYVWSLLDNYEWAFGHDRRSGIVHVDYDTLRRTPKDSYRWYQRLIAAQA